MFFDDGHRPSIKEELKSMLDPNIGCESKWIRNMCRYFLSKWDDEFGNIKDDEIRKDCIDFAFDACDIRVERKYEWINEDFDMIFPK